MQSNQLVFGKYEIIEQIGQGAFGKVYSGINIKTMDSVAIKIESRALSLNLLKSEALYLFMLKSVGIPKLYAFGKNDKYNILVETLLAKSLSIILEENKKKIRLKDSLMIAIQIIERIEYLHSKLLIHRDIKPDNFLIGYDDPHIIYLIDFGLCQKYRSNRTRNHIKFSSKSKFTGTIFYGSINSLKGNQPSRRDDLESAAYTIIRLMKGSLPWESIKAKTKKELFQRIFRIKIFTTCEELCEGLPNEIKEFLLYCRSLDFEQEPNYKYCYSLFNNVLIKNGFSNDLIFSWIKDPNLINKLKNTKIKIYNSYSIKRKSSPQIRLFNSLQSSIDSKNRKSQNIEEICASENNQYKRNNRQIKIIYANNNSLADSVFNDTIGSKENINPLAKISLNKKVPQKNFLNILNKCLNSEDNLFSKKSSYTKEQIRTSINKKMRTNEEKKIPKRKIKKNISKRNINNKPKFQNFSLTSLPKEKQEKRVINEKLANTINYNNNNFYKTNNYPLIKKLNSINNNIGKDTNLIKSNSIKTRDNNINNGDIGMLVNINQKTEINKNKRYDKTIMVNNNLLYPLNNKTDININISLSQFQNIKNSKRRINYPKYIKKAVNTFYKQFSDQTKINQNQNNRPKNNLSESSDLNINYKFKDGKFKTKKTDMIINKSSNLDSNKSNIEPYSNKLKKINLNYNLFGNSHTNFNKAILIENNILNNTNDNLNKQHYNTSIKSFNNRKYRSVIKKNNNLVAREKFYYGKENNQKQKNLYAPNFGYMTTNNMLIYNNRSTEPNHIENLIKAKRNPGKIKIDDINLTMDNPKLYRRKILKEIVV